MEPNSFQCQKCGGKTSVRDSRPRPNGTGIKRRRHCMASDCGHRFTTMEIASAGEFIGAGMGEMAEMLEARVRDAECGLADIRTLLKRFRELNEAFRHG